MSNKELAEELHKPIIGQFKKRKAYWFFIDHIMLYNIWGANFADMQLISKLNKGIRFWLFVTDIFGNMRGLIHWTTKNQVKDG